MNKKILIACAFLLTLVQLNSAHAYDEDGHFYVTYTLARYAGIGHPVAQKLALSAQWMDESYISDPISMIVLPVTGIKKRRLLHFPSSRVVGQLNATAQQQIFGLEMISDVQKALIEKVADLAGYKGELENLTFFTETEEDHPFASQLLMEGMKEGNLMKTAAGLHVLEDSFAHAGTPAEQGHALFWHWPDRPFASFDKFGRMTSTVFKAMVAIRALLPKEALDCGLQVSTLPVANCKLTAAQLGAEYGRNPLVRKAISYNVLSDEEYIKTAIRELLIKAKRVGYVDYGTVEIDTIVAGLKISPGSSAFDVFQDLLAQALGERTQHFNVGKVLADMGRLQTNSAISILDYIDSFGSSLESLADMDPDSQSSFAKVIASELLRWNVPSPLNDSHRMELEDDSSPIRLKEMEIRVRNIRAVISQLFGIDLEFVSNNTKGARGFLKEVKLDPTAEAVTPKNGGQTVYATFSLKEKNEWDHMIFNYLFPDLDRGELEKFTDLKARIDTLNVQMVKYLEDRKKINASNSNFFVKKAKLLKLDFDNSTIVHDLPATINNAISTVQPVLKTFISDTINTHELPSTDNYFYRSGRLFQAYRQQGVIKQFLSKDDVWQLDTL